MALKLIIDTAMVIQRMSLQDITEVRDTVDSMLNAAHVLLQGILHTTFEPGLYTDTFYLQPNRYPTSPNGLVCCRLKQAFVEQIVSISFSAEDRKRLTTTPTLVPAEDYVMDPVRGYLMIEDTYLGSWVSINYKAGFSSTNKPPLWLQEAVLAYLPHLLAQPAGATNAALINAATNAQSMAFRITGKIVEPYLRNRAFQYDPFFT